MRIVVKVGTSTLAYATGRLNIQRVERMCRVLSDLKNAGHEIILVSSGAIAMGFGKLNLRERPHDMPTKQASAAVGQCELMYVYDKLFTEYNHTVAQLLITAPDIADGGSRKENFHNTLDRLNGKSLSLAGGSGSELGTGGMVTKLHAAQIATEAGCEMVIANGWNPDLLYGIVGGEPIGTRFLAKKVSK